ncbi:MAG: hypothetical protein ACRC30_15285 [Clostridium sp.]
MDEFIFCFGVIFFIVCTFYIEEVLILKSISKIFVGEVFGDYRFACKMGNNYFYKYRGLFMRKERIWRSFRRRIFVALVHPIKKSSVGYKLV